MADPDVASLADVVSVLDDLYDPRTAEAWDAVGLACGDPSAQVRRVLFAVDPVPAVADEAVAWGADLIVTHHPLFLRGVHGVAATTTKGRLVHDLISAGIALQCVHTNADSANPGVSDALAAALGVHDLRPIKALEPAFDVLELAALPGTAGLGRIGRLPQPESLRDFTRRVAQALPRTASGVRASGDPNRLVSTVAVCGGAGDSLLGAVAAAGVDAYVTADLRHHPASEADGPALLDAAHWATEWPWLADAAARVERALSARGVTVETKISSVVTDPWTLHAPGSEFSTGGDSAEGRI